jgi:hypothetical protein
LDERHELEVIRRIRNDFAHQLGTVSFGDPTVKARCDSLLLPERMYVPDVIPVPKSADGPLPTVDLHFPSNVSARERFRMSVIYLMHNLTARFADAVHERRSIPADFQSPEEMWTHYLARIEAMMQEKDELTQRLNELEQQLGEPQSEVSNSEMVASAHMLTKYLVQLLERSRQAHDR